jgi:hypothetical protein
MPQEPKLPPTKPCSIANLPLRYQGLANAPVFFYVSLFLLQSSPPGRIIARLYVMGGAIAQLPVNRQASFQGHRPLFSPFALPTP